MSFSNPYSTKTARVSTITAAETNAAGAAIAQAIDGTGGGTYTPVSPINIGGANGLRIASGGFLTVLSGGTLSVPSGGTLSAAGGSTVTLAGTNTLSGATTAADLTMTSTNRVKLASRSITRVQSSIPSTNDATTWRLAVSGGYMEQIANATDYVVFDLRVPHGATLTAVTAYVQGAAGHGALPAGADKADLAVYVIPATGAIGAPLGVVSDPETLIAVYEASHTIQVSGLSTVIDRTANRYTAIVKSETGANYVAGLRVFAVAATYTITAYDED